MYGEAILAHAEASAEYIWHATWDLPHEKQVALDWEQIGKDVEYDGSHVSTQTWKKLDWE